VPDLADLHMSNDHAEAAFAFAQDTTKQVVTLSTGLIAITVAFLGDIEKTASPGALTWLHDAWITAGLSAGFGVLTLMMLTGHMGGDNPPEAKAIYSWPIRLCYGLEFLAFGLALFCTIKFGIRAS
jgi:hypothetical protein